MTAQSPSLARKKGRPLNLFTCRDPAVVTFFDAAEQFVEVRFGRVVLHLRDDVRDPPSGPNKFVVEGVKVDLFISFNQGTLLGSFNQRTLLG